jgi:hypothetical protein
MLPAYLAAFTGLITRPVGKSTILNERIMQTYLKTKPVWIQFLIFLSIAFGLFVIVAFVGVAVLSRIAKIDPLTIQDTSKWDLSNPAYMTFIRGMLVLQFLGLFVIPSLLFAYFSDPHPGAYLGLRPPRRPVFWILAVAIMLVSIPLVEYLGLLNQQARFGPGLERWLRTMEDDANRQIQLMLSRHSFTELTMNLIFISLFAGIGEELFFRGILQRMLIRTTKNPWVGIVLTAAVFSFFHLQFYGFVPRFLLGIFLGAVYWYSGSLLVAMLAHFVYDALFIVIAYFRPEMAQQSNATITNPANMLALALVSTVLTVALLWQMKKQSDSSYLAVYEHDRPSPDTLSF